MFFLYITQDSSTWGKGKSGGQAKLGSAQDMTNYTISALPVVSRVFTKHKLLFCFSVS